MDKKRSNRGKEKGGKKKIGIILLVVVILILVAVIIYLLLSRNPDESERRNVVVTPNNVEDVIEQMDESVVATGYYTVTMNYEWHFATGDAISSDAYVENVVGNTNAVYFDVFLAEDEEEAIYKSPVIPVGSSLQEIALDTSLDAGTYDCVVVYHLVDEYQNTISTLRVTVTIVVEG